MRARKITSQLNQKAAEKFQPLFIVYRHWRAGMKPTRQSNSLSQDRNLDPAVYALLHAILRLDGKIALTGDNLADAAFDA